MRRRRTTALFSVALLALLAPGCITIGPDGESIPPQVRVHSLDDLPPPVRARPKGTAVPLPVAPTGLAVREFGARRRYRGLVVQRNDDGTVSFLDLERWAEDPRDGVTDAVRESLAASGLFRAVFDASTDHDYEWTLDGYVLACELVATGDGPYRARLRLPIELGERTTGKVLHSGVYEVGKPLPGRDAAGLGKAMTECVGEALAKAVTAWRKSALLPR